MVVRLLKSINRTHLQIFTAHCPVLHLYGQISWQKHLRRAVFLLVVPHRLRGPAVLERNRLRTQPGKPENIVKQVSDVINQMVVCGFTGSKGRLLDGCSSNLAAFSVLAADLSVYRGLLSGKSSEKQGTPTIFVAAYID